MCYVILKCTTIYKLFCKTFVHLNAKDGWQCSFNEQILKNLSFPSVFIA